MRLLLLVSLALLVLAEKGPRLRFSLRESRGFRFQRAEPYVALKHVEGEDVLFAGRQDSIYMLNFTEKGTQDVMIPILSEESTRSSCLSRQAQNQLECDNFITVIEKVDQHLLVCGTNAGAPKCWTLVNGTILTEVGSREQSITASDVSPPFPSERFVSLSAGGNLYSALSADGKRHGFIARTFGPRKLLKTENKWLQNPQFSRAALIPGSQPYTEEIYFFFSEMNHTADVDEEPYRARVARVCMVDEGSNKNVLQNSWTTFLKARLMCGLGSTAQQYNNLKEAFVLTTQEKRMGVMYGLFANAWDTTVVCAYSIEDMDTSFSTSTLKGHSSTQTGYRPRACVFKNVTSSLAERTLMLIRDYWEIEQVIWPVGEVPLDLPTGERFTRIVADTVLAVNDEHYSVVYLGTEKGKVLKVLHTIDEAFIVSQYSPFESETPVIAMAIDSRKGQLYVGSSGEIQRIPLADCGRYGDSCRGCILSRDPYCGWDVGRKKCVPVPEGYNISSGGIIQNLEQSNSSVCGRTTGPKPQRLPPTAVLVDPEGPIFLPCPVRSYHAAYHWEKVSGPRRYPCSISAGSCVLTEGPQRPLQEGVYRCMSQEDGHREEVVSYRLLFSASPTRPVLGLGLLLAAACISSL